MLLVIKDLLINAANEKTTINYGKLLSAARLKRSRISDRNALARCLRDINEICVDAGKPPIGIIAVNKQIGNEPITPASGFFTYAKEDELYLHGETDEQLFNRITKAVYARHWTTIS